MSSILPRKGLNLEACFTSLYHILQLPAGLSRWPATAFLVDQNGIRTVSFLLAFGLLLRLNNWLSRMALNGWTRRQTWNPDKELILVTGGSSGIGAKMASRLAEDGSRVIILDINPPACPLPANTHFYLVDITSSGAIKRVAEDIRSQHGDPTVLINNAGVGVGQTILDEPETMIRRVFDVNIIAHFLLVKEFLPAMIQRNHGHIVTIASMVSFMAQAQIVDYACTKAAALAFHEGLTQELRHRYNAPAVRTTIVHPTWTHTPLVEKVTRSPGFRAFCLEPQTVADAVVDQIYSGYGGQLILPGRLSLLCGARGFPSWVQESLRNLGGQGTAAR